jgi:hypothetical protein
VEYHEECAEDMMPLSLSAGFRCAKLSISAELAADLEVDALPLLETIVVENV